MSAQHTFGKRHYEAPSPHRSIRVVLSAPVEFSLDPARVAAIMRDAHAEEVATARELDQWKGLRQAKKRSFREPWRTVSIVAGLGFALGAFVLPDSVAMIAQLVSGGLALGAFLAGFRRSY